MMDRIAWGGGMALALLVAACGIGDDAAPAGGDSGEGTGIATPGNGSTKGAGGGDGVSDTATGADSMGGAGAGPSGGATPPSQSGSGSNPSETEGDGASTPQQAPLDAGAGDPTVGGDTGASCIVAARLDRCCGEFVAVTPDEIAADECLVPYANRNDDPQLATDCLARSPVSCALVLCAPSVVPSRLAAPDANGSCRFVDECESVADCVRASDVRPCCDCGEGYPASYARSQPCLVIEGDDTPQTDCRPVCQATCGACPEPEALRCGMAPGASVRRCL